MTSFSLILGGTSCTLCGTEVSPSRAGGFHAPITETHSLKIRLPAPQSTPVTSFERVIAAFLPLRCQLAGRFERSGPVFGARLPAIFSRIRRDIRPGLLNFCRPLMAAGKPSFLCSLLKHRQEPRSGIFNALTLAPAFLPVPVLHASNRHQKDTRDHGKSYAQHG